METIKRYSLQELTDKLEGLCFEDLANSTVRWENGTQADSGRSFLRMDLEEGLTNCVIYRDRIEAFIEKSVDKSLNKEQRTIYAKAVELLYKLSDDEELTTIPYSKALYEREKNIYNSRFYQEFPLDKKINSLYDDFSVFTLRYCNISAIWNNKQALIKSYKGDRRALERFAGHAWPEDKEKQKRFLSLSTDEDRCALLEKEYGKDHCDILDSLEGQAKVDFVKQNVEFTHLCLGPTESSAWAILLRGEIDGKHKHGDPSINILPKEYADCAALKLSDTMKIQNNDLQQFMQTKIDIDKENLDVVDERNIRGDIYKILKAPSGFDRRSAYIIRYVCPSTGRVYFNSIDTNMISMSSYFKRDDVSTYSYAWWQVNNAGEDPMDEEDVIRC